MFAEVHSVGLSTQRGLLFLGSTWSHGVDVNVTFDVVVLCERIYGVVFSERFSKITSIDHIKRIGASASTLEIILWILCLARSLESTSSDLISLSNVRHNVCTRLHPQWYLSLYDFPQPIFLSVSSSITGSQVTYWPHPKRPILLNDRVQGDVWQLISQIIKIFLQKFAYWL